MLVMFMKLTRVLIYILIVVCVALLLLLFNKNSQMKSIDINTILKETEDDYKNLLERYTVVSNEFYYKIDISNQNNQFIQMSYPIGAIVPYVGSSIPSKFKECNGEWLNIAEYKALYNIMKFYLFKPIQDDGLFFKLPDLRGMFIRGETDELLVRYYQRHFSQIQDHNHLFNITSTARRSACECPTQDIPCLIQTNDKIPTTQLKTELTFEGSVPLNIAFYFIIRVI